MIKASWQDGNKREDMTDAKLIKSEGFDKFSHPKRMTILIANRKRLDYYILREKLDVQKMQGTV